MSRPTPEIFVQALRAMSVQLEAIGRTPPGGEIAAPRFCPHCADIAIAFMRGTAEAVEAAHALAGPDPVALDASVPVELAAEPELPPPATRRH